MRDPMDRSQRLMDGTWWRTFIRLLRMYDLMTSYTKAPSLSWPPRGGSALAVTESSHAGTSCSYNLPARYLLTQTETVRSPASGFDTPPSRYVSWALLWSRSVVTTSAVP